MNVRRPKPGDTEDDLLREMAKFQRENPNQSEKTTNEKPNEEDPRIETGPDISSIVKDNIVERTPILTWEPELKIRDQKGFPSVFKVDIPLERTNGSNNNKKKKSLFAQKLNEKQGHEKIGIKPNFGQGSRILNPNSRVLNESEIRSIHDENVSRLNSMAPEEIEKMRSQLLKELEPKTIQFLTAKKAASKPEREEEEEKVEKMIVEDQDIQKASINPRKDVGLGDVSVGEDMVESFKDFVHMDDAEPEKMEWLGDMEFDEQNNPRSGFSARFDFKGHLLPFKDKQTPVNEGLHHHGEEQERPGYTIDELRTLSRSTNTQQKVIALNSISKIVKLFKTGAYDGVLEQNLLSEVLDGGILTAARTCLDEKNETLRQSALNCIRTIIDCEWDEFLLDLNYPVVFQGHYQPSFPTEIVYDPESVEEFNKTKHEMTDLQMLKLDVVEGLKRMQLIERLTYILLELNPNPASVLHITNIAIRMARHKLATAQELLHYPGFLEGFISQIYKSKAEGKIVFSIMKLFRVFSSWSKDSAKLIVEKASLDTNLLPKLLAKESGRVDVALEALRLWNSLLEYGLLTQLFLDMFPLLVRNLVVIRGEVDPSSSSVDSTGEILGSTEVACALFKVLETVLKNQFHKLLEWRHVQDVHEITRTILQLLMRSEYDLTLKKDRDKLKLLTCVFNTFGQGLKSQSKNAAVADITQEIQQFQHTFLGTFLQSEVMKISLRNCIHFSFANDVPFKERDPKNLPSLNVFAFKGNLAKSADEKSPFPFLSSVSKFLATLFNLNKNLDTKPLAFWLNENGKYYEFVANLSNNVSTSWFCNSEISFLANCLILGDHARSMDKNLTLILAQKTLAMLPAQHAFYSRTLFRILLRNLNFSTAEDLIHPQIENLDLKQTTSSSKPFEFCLSEIEGIFERYLPSRNLNSSPSELKTLTVRNSGESLLPNDWMYLPLVNKFNESEKHEHSEDKLSHIVIPTVRLVYLQVLQRSEMFGQEFALHYSRLTLTFLLSSDLFMNEEFAQVLANCLKEMLKKLNGRAPDFEEKIPGVESFRDLYASLVDHFVSVSYGNTLFALFMLIPCGFSRNLRIFLWLNHADNLRTITITKDVVCQFLSFEEFFLCDSEDEDLLNAYASAILNRFITKTRNSFMFEMAYGNLAKTQSELKNKSCSNIGEKFFNAYQK